MKREFLQNLRAGDQPLSKETVDVIMAENGRDIEKVKAGYADYETLKDRVTELESREHDWQQLQQSAKQWQEKYETAKQEHTAQLDSLEFQHCVADAITAEGGRSRKAICALLDMDALRVSENRQEAVARAVSALREENGYLFAESPKPPVYADGTGVQKTENSRGPATLAGALREKFERMN